MPFIHTTENKLRRVFLPLLLTPWEKIVKRNYSVDNTVSNVEVKNWFKKIEESTSRFDLIRIGEPGDGSYIIPSDLKGINQCISLGYGEVMTFEKHLSNLGIKSLIVDKVVPNQDYGHFEFVDKYIGVISDSGTGTISMNDLLARYVDKGSEVDSDLILQIDIEADEWLLLNSLDAKVIERFRILIVELHSLHLLRNRWIYSNIMNPTIEKIMKSHAVVKLEVNCTSGFWSLNNREWFPDTIEVTFHRNDRNCEK